MGETQANLTNYRGGLPSTWEGGVLIRVNENYTRAIERVKGRILLDIERSWVTGFRQNPFYTFSIHVIYLYIIDIYLSTYPFIYLCIYIVKIYLHQWGIFTRPESKLTNHWELSDNYTLQVLFYFIYLFLSNLFELFFFFPPFFIYLIYFIFFSFIFYLFIILVNKIPTKIAQDERIQRGISPFNFSSFSSPLFHPLSQAQIHQSQERS